MFATEPVDKLVVFAPIPLTREKEEKPREDLEMIIAASIVHKLTYKHLLFEQ